MLVVMFGWMFASLISAVATTTSITLSSNKVQNGDILVPANPGPSEKWPLKQTETISANYEHLLSTSLQIGADQEVTPSNPSVVQLSTV